MPRRFRPGKARRTLGFPWAQLCLRDQLRLESELMPELPIPEGLTERTRLVAASDFDQAYHENRGLLLTPKSAGNPAGHLTGRRPWGFWLFEQDREPPAEQLLELHRLGELGARERAALVEDLRLSRVRFSDAEAELIATWMVIEPGTVIPGGWKGDQA